MLVEASSIDKSQSFGVADGVHVQAAEHAAKDAADIEEGGEAAEQVQAAKDAVEQVEAAKDAADIEEGGEATEQVEARVADSEVVAAKEAGSGRAQAAVALADAEQTEAVANYNKRRVINKFASPVKDRKQSNLRRLYQKCRIEQRLHLRFLRGLQRRLLQETERIQRRCYILAPRMRLGSRRRRRLMLELLT